MRLSVDTIRASPLRSTRRGGSPTRGLPLLPRVSRPPVKGNKKPRREAGASLERARGSHALAWITKEGPIAVFFRVVVRPVLYADLALILIETLTGRRISRIALVVE